MGHIQMSLHKPSHRQQSSSNKPGSLGRQPRSDTHKQKVTAGSRQVARERSGRRPKEGSPGMPENGKRRFQLSKSAKVGEDMGTEESLPIAVLCAKEVSSASSSLQWSPQWRQPYARIRFGPCPNVNSQGTSLRATVT